jgi:hypothetical protein
MVDEIVDLLEHVDGDIDNGKRQEAEQEDAEERLENVTVMKAKYHVSA